MAVNKEVKMVAAKGQNLLATSATITGSECSHVQLLGVIKAESQVLGIRDTNTKINIRKCLKKIQRKYKYTKTHQVVAGKNYRLVLKIRRKTGPGCSDDLEQV